MNLSASQLETVELCGRKWLFRYKHYLPEVKKDTQSFGNVLHGVCERYLDGAPLAECFPQGWDICPDAKKQIPPIDSALIQVLVTEAVASGVLERRPGGEVEKKFEIEVLGHRLKGKKDYALPDRIEDHKNSKSTRYFKSTEALKKTLQMLIYAKDNLEKEYRAKGKVPPKFFTLVHNQYLRDYDNPTVRRREAEVTPAEIDAFWEEKVVPLVRKCEELSQLASPFHVPEPEKKACEAFWGCSYVSICHGGEEMLTYKERVSKFQNPQQQPQMTISPQDFLAKRNAQIASSTPAAINPSAPAPVPLATTGAPAVVGDVPPWFDPNCPVCKRKETNKGFNTEGRPCRMCLTKDPRAADDYDLRTDATGKILWTKKGAAAPAGSVQAVPAAVTTPTKTALGVEDMIAELKAATNIQAVGALFDKAEKVLGAGSAEYLSWAAAAEARLEQMAAPAPSFAAPLPPPPAAPARIITDPTPTTITPIAPPPASGPTPIEVEAMKQTAAAALAATEAPKPPKRGPGRPKKTQPPAEAEQQVIPGDDVEDLGMVLLVGCLPVPRGEGLPWPGRRVVLAEEILAALPGYWQNQDVFKRRDEVSRALASADSEILEKLSGAVVVQQLDNPDITNLVAALIPHASLVIRGVR